MSRVAFLFRTDVHVSDKSPVSWKGDYPAEIWSNLRQVGDLARKHEVQAVLDGGDYFHIKAASRNPHAIVVQSAEIQNTYHCPTWCVEGNHDISYNNLGTIEKQPLGVLYATGTFHHLREQVFEDGSLRVRVVGVPYSPTRTLAELRTIKKKPGDSFLIAIVHALAGHNPPASVEDFFGEPVFKYTDLVYPDGPDLFCFGHWHKDQGIVPLDGCTFMNLGAVSRGALIRENLERAPKIGLIEVTPEGIVTTPIALDVLPASEVFDLERKERQDEQVRNIDHFVQRLQEDVMADPEATIEDALANLTFAKEVREAALTYLEQARLKRAG
jgi:DNA repair exonuclease SbcCD nuclease subunit